MADYEYIGLPIVVGATGNILSLDPDVGVIKVLLPSNIKEKFDKAIVHLGNQSHEISYALYQLKQPATFSCRISTPCQFTISYELFSGVSLLDTSGTVCLTVIPFSVLDKIKAGTPFYLQDLSTFRFLAYRNIQLDTWTNFPYIPSEVVGAGACQLQYLNNKLRYVRTGFYLCTSLGIRERFFENGLSDSCADRSFVAANDTNVLSFNWEFNEITENIFSLYTPSVYCPYQLNLFTPDDNSPTGIARRIGTAPLTQWRVYF